MTRAARSVIREEHWLVPLLVAPALAFILAGSLLPIAATTWEALHGHDLRLPWLGRPFIGIGNFAEAAGDPRFRAALVHTVAFAAVTVPVELGLGLALALIMQTATRGLGAVRLAALLPWVSQRSSRRSSSASYSTARQAW